MDAPAGLPERSGYFLGLEVVRRIARIEPLDAMVCWNQATIHERVAAELSRLAAD
jgi:hypothetical protein